MIKYLGLWGAGHKRRSRRPERDRHLAALRFPQRDFWPGIASGSNRMANEREVVVRRNRRTASGYSVDLPCLPTTPDEEHDCATSRS